jgi:hypothetical protein
MAASAGAVAVIAPALADQEQAAHGFFERVPTVEELFEAGKFEEAIALLDPTIGNPRRFIIEVSRTKNPAIVGAYAEKACPYRPDLWHSLFYLQPLSVCQALWPLRRFALCTDYPMTFLVAMMMRAATLGDLNYMEWGIQALKDMDSLHELNRLDGTASYEYERPNYRTRYYRSPIIAAADNDQRKMVSLLLRHGADPVFKGSGDPLTDPFFKRCGSPEDGYHLLKLFASLRPLVLGFIKEPSAAVSDDHHQKVFKAVLYRPEFASEYITGKAGATVLHGAVIAQKRKLILLCLVYNRALIEAKSGDGFTPLRLAIGGYPEALQVILDFCYTKSQLKA